MISVTAGQGPAGSFVVNVNLTVPEVAVGVYVDVKLVAFENLPVGADHVPEVAPPPTVPANVIVPPAQTVWSIFALAVAAAFTVTVVVAVEEQAPTVIVKVYTPEAAVVALGIVGFCAVEVKPFGPVQL